MAKTVAFKKPKVKVAIEREQNVPENIRELRSFMGISKTRNNKRQLFY